MPDVAGEDPHFVAVESRPCPYTFETACIGCGAVYLCEPGCTFIDAIIEMLHAQGYDRLDD
jgi:hypothetical protein